MSVLGLLGSDHGAMVCVPSGQRCLQDPCEQTRLICRPETCCTSISRPVIDGHTNQNARFTCCVPMQLAVPESVHVCDNRRAIQLDMLRLVW